MAGGWLCVTRGVSAGVEGAGVGVTARCGVTTDAVSVGDFVCFASSRPTARSTRIRLVVASNERVQDTSPGEEISIGSSSILLARTEGVEVVA